MISRLRPNAEWLPYSIAVAFLVFCLLPADRIPNGDAPHLLGISERLAHELTHLQLTDFGAHSLSLIAPHPPLGYSLPTFGYVLGLGGLVPLFCALVSLALIWRGLLLFSRSEDSLTPPWIAMLLLMACPLFWLSLAEVHWDLFAAASLSMCIGHLAASNGLENRSHSRAFGVWMGIGFLTKYSFPVFALGPVLLVGIEAIRTKRLRGVLQSFLFFCITAGPWWLLRGGEALPYVMDSLNSSSHMVDRASISPVVDPLYYLIVLKDAFGWPGLLLLVLGLGACRTRAGRLALGSGGLGLILLSQMSQQEPRYLLPALPMLAYSSHVALHQLKKRWRWSAWALVLAIALPMLSFSSGANRMGREAPAQRHHEHHRTSLNQWGDWPRVHQSFLPVSAHPKAYRVDEALAQVQLHLQAEDGDAIGLMLDQEAGELRDALFFHRASRLGLFMDFVSLAPPPGGAGKHFGKFKGPFKIRNEAPTRFRLLYAAYKKGKNPRSRWLDRHPHEILHQMTLPNGLSGILVRLEEWVETDREELL